MPCAPRTATVTLETRARVRLRTEQSDSLKEVSLFQGCGHQQRRSFEDRLGTAASSIATVADSVSSSCILMVSRSPGAARTLTTTFLPSVMVQDHFRPDV